MKHVDKTITRGFERYFCEKSHSLIIRLLLMLAIFPLMISWSTALNATKVGVLTFDVSSGVPNDADYGSFVADCWEGGLADQGSVTVYSRMNINSVIHEQNLSLSSFFSQGDAIRFGQLTGVKYLIVGNIVSLSSKGRDSITPYWGHQKMVDGTAVIRVKMINTETGQIVLSKEYVGNSDTITMPIQYWPSWASSQIFWNDMYRQALSRTFSFYDIQRILYYNR